MYIKEQNRNSSHLYIYKTPLQNRVIPPHLHIYKAHLQNTVIPPHLHSPSCRVTAVYSVWERGVEDKTNVVDVRSVSSMLGMKG